MTLTILRIAERLPPLPGGKEVHVAELTRAQRARGNLVEVRYRFGDQAAVGGSATRVTPPSPLAQVGGLLGTTLFARAAVCGTPPAQNFDIVHAHGDLGEAWALQRPTSSPTGPAAVLTVHGRLNPRYRVISQRAFAHIDAFIALGDLVAYDLEARGVPPSRITTTSSGLNMRLLDAAKAPSRDPSTVVVVGSLDRVKSVETVIQAVQLASRGTPVRLKIIGDGPERANLMHMAEGDPSIQFLGQLPRETVYRHVAASGLFVIASQRQAGKGEGVPTALLEAMALGTACFVSTDATPGSVITDGTSYRTFRAGDALQLAGLVSRAVNGELDLMDMAQRARDAVSGLSWENRATIMNDVYHEAIRRHRERFR